MDHDVQSVFWRFGPRKDIFAPEHTQIIVNFPFSPELFLGTVPYLIVGLGVFQLLWRVCVPSRIVGVFEQSLLRPARKRLVPVIVGSVPAHVVAQLSPGYQFIQESLGVPAHSPPPLSLAGGACRKVLVRPRLSFYQLTPSEKCLVLLQRLSVHLLCRKNAPRDQWEIGTSLFDRDLLSGYGMAANDLAHEKGGHSWPKSPSVGEDLVRGMKINEAQGFFGGSV